MILVIDDDSGIRASLTMLLKVSGFEAMAVSSPEEALPIFRSSSPELILMDMNYSRATTGEEGLHLLRQAKIFLPDTPVILITAWGSIDLAVEGMKAGAFDFITKPWNNHALLQRINTAIRLSASQPEAEPSGSDFNRCGIIGSNPALMRVLETAARVARTDAPVLILGENGTGKELIARAIHANSRRADAPLVEVNLGGIPESLFESEMFGHAKGAFTGAVAARKGRFEMADHGSIFLDEIGDLNPASQVKMLRVLQEHTFEPLGDSRTRKVDIRTICATNADLEAMVAARTFREDLFYRINLITLRLPPLRERRDDIPALCRHFANSAAAKSGISCPEISAEAMDILTRLNYPGNIRQLKNIIERAVIIAADGIITADDIDSTGDSSSASISPIGVNADSPSPDLAGMTLSDIERTAILDAIAKYEGNLSRAALALGITRQALYRKMEKYEIPRKL